MTLRLEHAPGCGCSWCAYKATIRVGVRRRKFIRGDISDPTRCKACGSVFVEDHRCAGAA
jgi:hypothetical protein